MANTIPHDHAVERAAIAVHQATLHAEARGPAGAPGVVFMGSLASDAISWAAQMDALVRAGYRAVTFDYRGHGGSTPGQPPYTLELFMDDLRAVTRHFGVKRPVLVGLSLGGMVAMHAAVYAGADYAGIVVSAAKASMPEAQAAFWAQRAIDVRRDGVGIVVDGSLERWFTPPFHQSHPETIAMARAMILRTSAAAYADCINIVRNVDLLRHLGRVSIPSLYIVGAQDLAATPDEMRTMQQHTPGGQFEMIANAAHMPAIEQPEAFNRCLLDFLNAHCRT